MIILDQILQAKRKDLEELKRRFPVQRLKAAVQHTRPEDPRSFKKAVSGGSKTHLICELKKASPSQGVLIEDFQPLRIAGIYEAGGAAAISVLTEPHFFKGRPSYLRTVRQVTTIPLLRKDFIFESYQLYETALLHADAFLLIASVLTEEELERLITLGKELGMDALVEIHSEEDLDKAVGAGAEIIGVNNRNLRTLEVDPFMAKKIIPRIPKGIPIIIESGISRYEEIMDYKSIGIHAFLIGTTLMKSVDIAEKLAELTGRSQKWVKE
jgi:indole-3-glycerol phosphate synthase